MYEYLRIMLKRGAIIGSSRDTGYDVFRKFARCERCECLTPVFKIKNSLIKPQHLAGFLNRLIEMILPEKRRYIPNKKTYSERSFKDFGLEDYYAKGWDEFLWKGKPFGFHIQGAQKDGTIKNNENAVDKLKELQTL